MFSIFSVQQIGLHGWVLSKNYCKTQHPGCGLFPHLAIRFRTAVSPWTQSPSRDTSPGCHKQGQLGYGGKGKKHQATPSAVLAQHEWRHLGLCYHILQQYQRDQPAGSLHLLLHLNLMVMLQCALTWGVPTKKLLENISPYPQLTKFSKTGWQHSI